MRSPVRPRPDCRAFPVMRALRPQGRPRAPCAPSGAPGGGASSRRSRGCPGLRIPRGSRAPPCPASPARSGSARGPARPPSGPAPPARNAPAPRRAASRHRGFRAAAARPRRPPRHPRPPGISSSRDSSLSGSNFPRRRFMRQAFAATRKTQDRSASGWRRSLSAVYAFSSVSCRTSRASSRWPHILTLKPKILSPKRSTNRSKAPGSSLRIPSRSSESPVICSTRSTPLATHRRPQPSHSCAVPAPRRHPDAGGPGVRFRESHLFLYPSPNYRISAVGRWASAFGD